MPEFISKCREFDMIGVAGEHIYVPADHKRKYDIVGEVNDHVQPGVLMVKRRKAYLLNAEEFPLMRIQFYFYNKCVCPFECESRAAYCFNEDRRFIYAFAYGCMMKNDEPQANVFEICATTGKWRRFEQNPIIGHLNLAFGRHTYDSKLSWIPRSMNTCKKVRLSVDTSREFTVLHLFDWSNGRHAVFKLDYSAGLFNVWNGALRKDLLTMEDDRIFEHITDGTVFEPDDQARYLLASFQRKHFSLQLNKNNPAIIAEPEFDGLCPTERSHYFVFVAHLCRRTETYSLILIGKSTQLTTEHADLYRRNSFGAESSVSGWRINDNVFWIQKKLSVDVHTIVFGVLPLRELAMIAAGQNAYKYRSCFI